MYSISAIGDLRTGELGSSLLLLLLEITKGAVIEPVDEDGRPDMSSWTSVTTKPLAVISLLRMMRLCGNKPREV